MDQPSSETFYGYCMSEDGTYGEPVQLHSAKEVGDFLLDNVQKTPRAARNRP